MSPSNFFRVAATVTLLASTASAAFDIASPNNVAVYWGQGPDQQPLSDVCSDPSFDTVILGFITGFPRKVGDYPVSNFGNACQGDFFTHPTDSTQSNKLLKTCAGIAPGIKECHKNGKKVLLSLGGGQPTDYYLPSQAVAKYFAEFLVGAFGSKDKSWTGPRPFGDEFVDGFDLDLEAEASQVPTGGISANYAYFVNQLKTIRSSLLISAAPQCVVPDIRLADAIKNAPFDMIFTQFYNTYDCSAKRGYEQINDANTGFTFNKWAEWLQTNSKNNAVKLYMGLPAGKAAANSAHYLAPDQAYDLVRKWKAAYPSIFGGVMLWEAKASFSNQVKCHSFGYWMKSTLDGRFPQEWKSGCAMPSATPTTSAAASPTATISSPDGTCGDKKNGLAYNCYGYSGGSCCSNYGYCGGNAGGSDPPSAWCGVANCNPLYGDCDGKPRSSTVRSSTVMSSTVRSSTVMSSTVRSSTVMSTSSTKITSSSSTHVISSSPSSTIASSSSSKVVSSSSQAVSSSSSSSSKVSSSASPPSSLSTPASSSQTVSSSSAVVSSSQVVSSSSQVVSSSSQVVSSSSQVVSSSSQASTPGVSSTVASSSAYDVSSSLPTPGASSSAASSSVVETSSAVQTPSASSSAASSSVVETSSAVQTPSASSSAASSSVVETSSSVPTPSASSVVVSSATETSSAIQTPSASSVASSFISDTSSSASTPYPTPTIVYPQETPISSSLATPSFSHTSSDLTYSSSSSSVPYPVGNASTPCTTSTQLSSSTPVHVASTTPASVSSTPGAPVYPASSSSKGHGGEYPPFVTSTPGLEYPPSPATSTVKTITTTYIDSCETGITTKTETITQTVCNKCQGDSVTSTYVCKNCGPAVVTITITKPSVPTYVASHPTPPAKPEGPIYGADKPKPSSPVYGADVPKKQDYPVVHSVVTVKPTTVSIVYIMKTPVPVVPAGKNTPVPYPSAPVYPVKPTGGYPMSSGTGVPTKPSSTGSGTGAPTKPTYAPPQFTGAASHVGVGMGGFLAVVVGVLVL